MPAQPQAAERTIHLALSVKAANVLDRALAETANDELGEVGIIEAVRAELRAQTP